MNVDLEAVCKTYLLFLDSEFYSRFDSEAEYKEKETKGRLHKFDDLSKDDAKDYGMTFRLGMIEGYLTVASELRRLISIETGNEHKEFEKDLGYICPNCDNTPLLSKSDYVPVLDGNSVTSYVCPKCGFSREFPKAILVRDIFTEYANKEKEKEKEKEAEE